MDVIKVADAIVERLFKNGFNKHAKRLVLELEDGRDGGGWCRSAVRNVVIEVMGKPDPASKAEGEK